MKNNNKKNINKKKVLFIVLLCVNIAFFLIRFVTTVLSLSSSFWVSLYNLIYSQLTVTALSVVIYCSIDLVEAVKKIANQKETSDTALPDEKKEDHE